MRSVAAVAVGLVISVTAPAADQPATVEMRDTHCSVRLPADAVEDTFAFTVRNRSRRPRRFTIAGARTPFIAAGRRAVLRVALAAGTWRYACEARTRRNVHRGSVRVRPAPAPLVDSRIGVRSAEFYDRVTGERFVPRGANYIRLAPQTDPAGFTFLHHSTFDVGRYDAPRAERMLAQFQAWGYNVVRVFFSPVCLNVCLGDPTTRGLRREYLENVADFVRRAKRHGVNVLLTVEGVPAGSRWSDAVHRGCCEDYAGFSRHFLRAESVAAYAEFYAAVVRGLLDAGLPADAVFAYSLMNEAFFDGDRPPFSLRSGTRTTANGRTYDLSSAEQRRAMLEDGLVHWTDRMVEAIRAVAPTALVTIGFFHAHEPNPARRGDARLIYTHEVVARSTVDFVDFHPYPDDELTFPQFMENYGVTGREAKPLLMGEYGASHRAFASADAAARALVRWQWESCAHGFDGWLLWTWDTIEQPHLWNGLSAGGAIASALAATTRPDPCSPPS